MNQFLALVTAGCSLLVVGCSSPASVAPSAADTVVGAAVGDVGGQIVERYGGAPIQNAGVHASDGFIAAHATTAPDGRFVLRGLRATDLTLVVIASGFTTVSLSVSGPDLGQIGLQPSFSDYEWTGTFPDPVLNAGSGERVVPFETTHRGPVTLSFHAGCSTQSTTGPLWGSVYRANETDANRYLMWVEFGSYVDRDYSEETVVPPGAYYARLRFDNQTRNGCAWSIRMRYPL